MPGFSRIVSNLSGAFPPTPSGSEKVKLNILAVLLTSVKVFVWDLSGSANYQKVVFLMMVGGITLVAGYFYGKGKGENVIREGTEQKQLD